MCADTVVRVNITGTHMPQASPHPCIRNVRRQVCMRTTTRVGAGAAAVAAMTPHLSPLSAQHAQLCHQLVQRVGVAWRPPCTQAPAATRAHLAGGRALREHALNLVAEAIARPLMWVQ